MDRGDEVQVVTEKWGATPHRQHRAVYLGADEHGLWLGAPAGTHHRGPGGWFVSAVDAVTLVPPLDADERGHLATFYAAGSWCDTYVDITTPPTWEPARPADGAGAVLRCTDLDLDVVRDADGRVHVDDEDELAENRLALGYPPEVVAAAERSCAAVHAAVLARRPPFDRTTAAPWSAALRALVGERG